MNTLNFQAYLIYLPIVIILTWYVAHTLFKNSLTFMLDIFHQKVEIAKATNRLFETGFYLLNIGFAFITMQIDHLLTTNQTLVETLSSKVGAFSIYLGVMLFLNLYLFFRGRKIARQQERKQLMQTN
jgi:hypothetical protein